MFMCFLHDLCTPQRSVLDHFQAPIIHTLKELQKFHLLNISPRLRAKDGKLFFLKLIFFFCGVSAALPPQCGCPVIAEIIQIPTSFLPTHPLPFIYPFTYSWFYPSIHPCKWSCIHKSRWVYIYTNLGFLHACIYIPLYPSTHLSIHPSIYHLSIHEHT